MDLDDLIAGVRARDRAALGRAITLVESEAPEGVARAQELLRRLLPLAGDGYRIGITGVPGAGKSTFIETLGCRLVDRGHRVAVLAVDPSSSISRGSILGDKTRMEELARRDDAFIRPSPSRGFLGGVARATRESIIVCESAGFDVIIVETVGVGQSETLVADMVDVFLALMLAGAGDELQGIKRGVLELADILAVNKADAENRPAAERARADLARALEILRPGRHRSWRPRVVTCSARTGDGLEEIWALVEDQRRALLVSGELRELRRDQRVRWMWATVEHGLRSAVRRHPRIAEIIAELEKAVGDGRTTPTEAATTIFDRFTAADDG